MEPYEINLSLVAGTAGTWAVAWSEPRQEWLVCHVIRGLDDVTSWLFVESSPTEDGARKLARALYARDQEREACR
jgi:hypothetical protein